MKIKCTDRCTMGVPEIEYRKGGTKKMKKKHLTGKDDKNCIITNNQEA